MIHWRDLTKPYVFSEEYRLLRNALAPDGTPPADCTLLTFNSLVGVDADVHDFSQVVPGMKTIDCVHTNCAAELSPSGCFYYVRSAASYFHREGIPFNCIEADRDTSCMNEQSTAFEKSVDLEPLEVRTINIAGTFPDFRGNYPRGAEIGLFRVRPKDLR